LKSSSKVLVPLAGLNGESEQGLRVRKMARIMTKEKGQQNG
jgi:hypothetical protein